MSKKQAVTILRFLYPAWAIIGMFSLMYVPSKLIVPADAMATANNIMTNGFLFRLGIVGSLMTQLIQIVVLIVLYQLFKSVDKKCVMNLMIFGMLGIPIAMLSTLGQIAALQVLGGGAYLGVFGIDQLHALAMLFLELNEQGVLVATIFWGLWLFPLANLVKKSGFFPKILGTLLMLAGFGYLIDSFAHFLAPSYLGYTAPVVSVLTLGEVLFMLWVVFKGTKLPKTES